MRYEKDITIEAEGRDKGKTFHIKEMPASVGEQWALDAINAIARARAVSMEELTSTPMAGLAALGLKALVSVAREDFLPLMAQMFSCVTIVVPAKPKGRPLIENDIEEIPTRLKLRQEVFELHTGFFASAASSNSEASAAAGVASSPST